MYYSSVLFHVLLQCKLLSPRLRAHIRSKLARLCPVHLCNTRSREGVLGKGLPHKPVPPLAKAYSSMYSTMCHIMEAAMCLLTDHSMYFSMYFSSLLTSKGTL